ncbi:MAG: phosphatase PAP2 family protein [Myxococcales bacterium]|nr:phosphatase PAP2 family protein [Polyangiaceae bacterium]MDW8250016.1 phosphatase PAP2 family protein [Myxococcales bacterium]
MRFGFFPSTSPLLHPETNRLLRTWKALAPQDYITLAYCLWMAMMALRAHGALATRVQQLTLSMVVCVVILGFRGGLWLGNVALWLYRSSLLAALQIPYFLLRDLLPAAITGTVDDMLLRLDTALFGVAPSLWLDGLITPGRTEWFAFFYFSYFLILAIHVLPILFLERRSTVAQHFAVGMLGVFAVGQATYFLLPGYGPYHHMEGQFQNALPGGFWMDTVWRTVQSGGAMLDIFPSLHTAGPLFIALFSFQHRALQPFRYTWPIAAFFSVNIIGATLYLRWHYAVDVLAGVMLAVAWFFLTPYLIQRDQERRRTETTVPAWPEPIPLDDSVRKR